MFNYSSNIPLFKESLVDLLRIALIVLVLDIPKYRLVLNIRNLGTILGLDSFS